MTFFKLKPKWNTDVDYTVPVPSHMPELPNGYKWRSHHGADVIGCIQDDFDWWELQIVDSIGRCAAIDYRVNSIEGVAPTDQEYYDSGVLLLSRLVGGVAL